MALIGSNLGVKEGCVVRGGVELLVVDAPEVIFLPLLVGRSGCVLRVIFSGWIGYDKISKVSLDRWILVQQVEFQQSFRTQKLQFLHRLLLRLLLEKCLKTLSLLRVFS